MAEIPPKKVNTKVFEDREDLLSIRLADNPSDSDKRRLVLRDFSVAEDTMNAVRNRWRKLFNNYLNHVEEGEFPYHNRMASPDTHSYVEHATAIEFNTVAGKQPIFTTKPRAGFASAAPQYALTDEIVGEAVTRLIGWCIDVSQANFYLNYATTKRAEKIFGDGFALCLPKIGKSTSGSGYDLDGIVLESIDNFNLFPDPRASCVADARFIVIRGEHYPEELLRREAEGSYKNARTAIKTKHSAVIEETIRTELEALGFKDASVPPGETVEILHHYADGHVISLANFQDIVQDSRGETSFKPFVYGTPIVHFRHVPLPWQLFSLGVAHSIQLLQKRRNKMWSQQADEVDGALSRVIMVDPNMDVDLETLHWHPHALWLASKDAVNVVPPTESTKQYHIYDQGIDEAMKRATGMYDLFMGQQPEQRMPATAVLNLQKAASVRPDMVMKLNEFYGLRELAQRIAVYIITYMSYERMVRILGSNQQASNIARLLKSIPLDEFLLVFDFKPVTSGITQQRELRMQQVQAGATRAYSIPPQVLAADGYRISYLELLKMELTELEIDTDRVLIPLQQQPQPGGGMMGPGQAGAPPARQPGGPTPEGLAALMQGGGG